MITGELKNKIDRVWDAFWSGGISNPLEVIEQITYLWFLRRLDEEQTRKERVARVERSGIVDPVYQEGQHHLRWSRFKDVDSDILYRRVADEVFPFLRELGRDGSTYAEHMRDARFTIPTPALLSRVVDMLSELPTGLDTSGDLYEYLLSKIASAGVNGQFRTPRHVIELMVAMMAPKPGEEICDPACGTAGFLMTAAEHVRTEHPESQTDPALRKHFHRRAFHGYDFDSTMLRIGSMNMLVHGVEAPDIRYRDSLSEGANEDTARYDVILANPPFAGSLDYETTSKDLQRVVKTKKTELLFLALFLKLLKPGGRAAVIVPDGVLFNAQRVYRDLREMLVERHRIEAVIKLPAGAFRPYTATSTAILVFTRTDSGGTDEVWFYDVRADGFSLDEKREPVEANDLPDALARWNERAQGERDRTRADQSFMVAKKEIVQQSYDLSFNRYREAARDDTERRPPLEIIAEIESVEREFGEALADLKDMLT